MSTAKDATDKTLEYEGWVIECVINDYGGETCAGITRKFGPKWRGWKLIDEMRTVEVKDKDIIKTERVRDAIYEYYEKWFDRLHLAEIDDPKKANQIFQLCVNAGDGVGVKFAQEIVGVECDGIIGPKTIKAVNEFDPEIFAVRYCARQMLFYARIVDKNKTQQKFYSGWVRRAKAFV